MRLGFHASHEQIAPVPAAGRRRARRAGRLRDGHVLRPLRALGHPAGPLRLHLGLAGGGARPDRPRARLRLRTRPALPPGRGGAEDRHPRRDVPRTLLDGAGQRRGQQRAHHRRPLAAQGGADPTPRGVRRRDPPPARRRGGQPRRPGHGRPGPAVGPARRSGRGWSVRRCRWPRPRGWPRGPTAWSPSTSPSRCCATSCRPTATPAAAARSPCRCTCRGHPPREEAEAIALDQWRTNVFPEPVCWDTETPRRFDVMAEHVDIEAVRRSVEVSARPVVAPRPDRRARRRRLRRRLPALRRPGAGSASSRPSAPRCSPPCGADARLVPLLVWGDASDRHERPVVEERGHLLPRHRDLLRLRRRRRR